MSAWSEWKYPSSFDPLNPPAGLGQANKEVSHRAGGGESEHPGPDHPLHNGPFDGVEAFGATDTHDGSGDIVGGRNRIPRIRRQPNDRRRTGLGRKAIDRMQFDHFVAQRLDNAPTAHRRTRGHGQAHT